MADFVANVAPKKKKRRKSEWASEQASGKERIRVCGYEASEWIGVKNITTLRSPKRVGVITLTKAQYMN
jgi:hypothetical protein